MPCEPFEGDGFSGLICSRGRRTPTRRCVCGSPNVLAQCDAPVTGKASGTCDAHLCQKCRVSAGANLDYCPSHATAANLVGAAALPGLG